MTPFARFLAFEAVGWLLVAALLTWFVRAEWVPLWGAALAFVLWVAKDFALYPLTRRAYEHGHTHGSAELLGAEVHVETLLEPEASGGWVRAGHERWQAQLVEGCDVAIEPGAMARVCALRGITLIVEPV